MEQPEWEVQLLGVFHSETCYCRQTNLQLSVKDITFALSFANYQDYIPLIMGMGMPAHGYVLGVTPDLKG